MKQVLRQGLKDVVVKEVPDPVLTSHHVLIKPVCSLISSGTETASIHTEGVVRGVMDNPSHLRKVWEVMKLNGPVRTLAEVHAKFSEYAVLGYSGAGVVVGCHPSVTELKVGDRVAYGGEGTGHGEAILAGKNLVAKIDDHVPFEQACFTTLGSIALNAVRTAKIGVGETVAVLGVGLVGQLVSQLVRQQGGVVIAIDLRAERVDLAKRLGADYGLIGGDSLVEDVHAITNGRGVDCVIVAAAAKSSGPCLQALRICRDRGKMVIVGAVELNLPWHEMYMKDIQLFMSRAYGPGSYDEKYERGGQDYPITYVRWTEQRNMEEFLRLVALGRIQLAPLVSHEFSLGNAAEAYRTIMNPSISSLAVLLRYPVSPITGSKASTLRSHTVVLRSEVSPRAVDASIGVALVGAGNLARWAHLPSLSRIPGVELQAVHSANGARGRTYGERFGARYCTTDYDEILNDPAVNLVIIVSRNHHHATQILKALKAGKHVFVEKPMALTEEECRELSLAVQESGRLLTVGFNRRFAPLYRRQKELLSRRTGAAVVNCRINSPGIAGTYWMADPSTGGAILGEACHFVDLMYWLLESEPISVSAFSLPCGQKEPIGENNLVASFRFADGSIGNLTYCTVGSRTSGGERVEVFAQGLGVVVQDFKRLEVQRAIRHSTSAWWADKGYEPQLKSFVEAIRAGRNPEVTVLDGSRATIGCLRMLESARDLRSVDIGLEAFSASLE